MIKEKIYDEYTSLQDKAENGEISLNEIRQQVSRIEKFSKMCNTMDSYPAFIQKGSRLEIYIHKKIRLYMVYVYLSPDLFSSECIYQLVVKSDSGLFPEMVEILIQRFCNNPNKKLAEMIAHLLEKNSLIYPFDWIKDEEKVYHLIEQIKEYLPKEQSTIFQKDIKEEKQNIMYERDLNEYLRLLGLEIDDLDDKNILNIGAGLGKLKKSLEGKINCEITALDPLYRSVSKESLDGIANKVIDQSFFEYKLEENVYNLIVSVHSLPEYCQTKEQILYFFENSLLSLKMGGKLIIVPSKTINMKWFDRLSHFKEPVLTKFLNSVIELMSSPMNMFQLTTSSFRKTDKASFFGSVVKIKITGNAFIKCTKNNSEIREIFKTIKKTLL